MLSTLDQFVKVAIKADEFAAESGVTYYVVQRPGGSFWCISDRVATPEDRLTALYVAAGEKVAVSETRL